MEREEAFAYPIHGYQIVASPDDLSVAILMFETEKGPTAYAAYREILETMAASFLKVAATLPRRTDVQ